MDETIEAVVKSSDINNLDSEKETNEDEVVICFFVKSSDDLILRSKIMLPTQSNHKKMIKKAIRQEKLNKITPIGVHIKNKKSI